MHPIEKIHAEHGSPFYLYDGKRIAGHLCSGADIMAKDVSVKKAKIGNLLTFNHAGSYARSLAPLLFTSQPQPKEFFLDEK